MDWADAINVARPHVVKIATPTGYGTGFLSFYNHDKTWCGIATAAHVVSHAEEWQEPIRILNDNSVRFLKIEDRVIMIDRSNDSAVVLFLKNELQLPEVPITLTPMDQPCSIGADAGWLGYPVLASDTLCFFAGSVSARLANRKSYLIDGVAINGVSGGPVFHSLSDGKIEIIGCVSQYHANVATGATLPGLLYAQDVSHFHGAAETIRNIDEANAQKAEFEQKQHAAAVMEVTEAADRAAATLVTQTKGI